MKVYGGCATNVGITRKVNQDSIDFLCVQKKKCTFALGIVCDGVGGLEKGEVASSFIVSKAREWFENTNKWIDIEVIDTHNIFSHLKDAVEVWNDELIDLSMQMNIKMGTTMSIIMIIRDDYYVIHVGDSRIYRENGVFEQLTADATVIGYRNGKTKALLNNYMGKNKELWFQAENGKINKGDNFLYCSDGFCHKLNIEDIHYLFSNDGKKKDGKLRCEQIILQLMQRGEKDNISAGLIFTEAQSFF